MINFYNKDKTIRDEIIIDWYPSLICNYKCSYCFVNKENKCFNKDNFSILLHFLKRQDKHIHLRILGGEPLIIKEINYVLEELNKIENFKVEIVTNGFYLKNIKVPKQMFVEISVHYEYINEKYIKNLKKGILNQDCDVTLVLNLHNELDQDILYKIKNVYDEIKDICNVTLNTIVNRVGERINSCLDFEKFMKYFEVKNYKECSLKYIINGQEKSFMDVISIYKQRKNNFKGCICQNNYLIIDYNYNLKINCSHELLFNILENKDKMLKHIKMVCKNNYCDEGCFVDNPRWIIK